MKKALFSIFALAIAFSSCKEPYSYVPPIDTNTIIDSSFRVTGIASIKTKVLGNYTLPITLSHLNGTPKNITLSIKGLPTNATASFTPNTQKAPFASTLTLKTELATAGIYPISIEANAENYAAQEFPINIQVEPFFSTNECTNYFMNSVYFNDTNHGRITYDNNGKILVKTVVNTFNNLGGLRINMTNVLLKYIGTAYEENFYNLQEIFFEIDCNKNIITMPAQEIIGIDNNRQLDTFNVSGSGTIDIRNNQYIINYTSDNNSYSTRGSFR